jgi:hypothetical protein
MQNNIKETNAWNDTVSMIRPVHFFSRYSVDKLQMKHSNMDMDKVVREKLSRSLGEQVDNFIEVRKIEPESIADYLYADIETYGAEVIIMKPKDLANILEKFGEDLLNEARREKKRF